MLIDCARHLNARSQSWDLAVRQDGSESMEEWLDRYHASTFELREIGVKAGAAL
jgi:hypothetical protein